MMKMSVRRLDAVPNMQPGYANLLENIKVYTVKYIRDMSKYSNLVEEIDKQEGSRNKRLTLIMNFNFLSKR